jgi:hypothetical protein
MMIDEDEWQWHLGLACVVRWVSWFYSKGADGAGSSTATKGRGDEPTMVGAEVDGAASDGDCMGQAPCIVARRQEKRKAMREESGLGKLRWVARVGGLMGCWWVKKRGPVRDKVLILISIFLIKVYFEFKEVWKVVNYRALQTTTMDFVVGLMSYFEEKSF